ncbi:hypothetical protein O7614_18820 [Micromonospora sp. WMMD961]|uniref:hypothetical protein n=1 Tax=Micromonospora sp. WMMD961 TaxID=3016100 RepID=UPI002416C12A|nr:hypothetical protein [Micromonospora sp. WMMD961]MDG4781710.1 hypothetical protein [Micromonospora sp. WMMD961]
MTNEDLTDLAASGGPYRGKAVFELVDRAHSDDDAAARLGQLSRLTFEALGHSEQADFLTYVQAERIEDAYPNI